MSTGVESTLSKARSAAKRGDFAAAERFYASVLTRFPGNAKARRGLADLRKGPAEEAVPQADIDRLVALYGAGRLSEVVSSCEALLSGGARSAMLYNVLGAAWIGLGQHEKAETAYTAAAALDPGDAEIHNNHGTALNALSRLDEATAAFRRALAIRPDYAEAHYNLGNALRKRHEPEAAMACYERALAIRPDDVESLNNLGLACRDLGRPEDALAAFSRALTINPGSADALHNLGVLMMELKDFDSAIKAYRLALSVAPEKTDVRGPLLYAMAHVCDFSAHDEYRRFMAEGLLRPGQSSPFTMLVFADDPARQLESARAWQASATARPASVPSSPRTGGDRIRLGYFSADFHDHATLHLMAGLLREHDRRRFEVIAYSYGPDSASDMRRDLVARVDRFVDIRDMSDGEVVRLARDHELDIAVDLKGYTQHSRSRLFVSRLAPVQVNYLGFPGSMGADFIDYLVADPVVVPPSERPFYSEKIAFLPDSYQPNDDRRAIVDTGARRRDFGLSDDSFVFCCFNHTYKIGPREFAIWMRLLDRVDDSVLWLLHSNETAEANLRREAEARGIDPARLVFAQTLPHNEHLGRLKHADLFLDTFNVNAHTTASDALWGGLPVLTKAGRQFAARVCASLVEAAGLPELVVRCEAEYEALALRLATEPELLGSLRERLATGRTACPLFDTGRYTRAFEAALEDMHRRRLRGLAPDDIVIAG